MSSSDSKPYLQPHNKPRDEWDKLDEEIIRLDDPDDVNTDMYGREGRVQMAYGCYRILRCKGAE